MAAYKYVAKDEKGKTVTGKMQAIDERDLHNKLRNDNKFLISSKEEIKEANTKRLKSDALSEFCRNLGELIGAGVSMVRSLRIMSEDEAYKPKVRALYSNILKMVLTGTALSDAMEAQGGAFPPLLINMIRSAEETGDIDGIAMQMAVYYDKDHRMNQKVKSSMTYPKLLTVLIVIVVAIIMGYVIPQFESLFATMPSLPISTRLLLGISNYVKSKWYVLVLIAIIVYIVFKVLFSFPKIRIWRDKMELKLPKIGYLRKVIYTARFARTLSSLYSAGISISNCMVIAKNTIGNAYIEMQFDQVIADIRAGEKLSDSIGKVDGFTRKIVSTIMVGEETGALDSMLSSVASQMEYDSEMALNRMVSYLEPVMIVIMATVVGFIMISVIQPIYGSYNAIANQ
ncbi:MAG: type II secretion system F family protein [Lachnospiraceae bacterium]|nr:type II secretion system F family protein [Lachnospiraceae bacterium]